MLKGAIICSDAELSERLTELLEGMGVVSIVRTLPRYPNANELLRMLRAGAPQVLFLGIDSLARALEVVASAESQLPGVQVIAVGRDADPQTLLELMRSGIREFLTMPFQRQLVYDALVRVKETLDRRPVEIETTDLVFSFLPSKPGVGTSIIAANTSIALSRIPDYRTLLIDGDLNSGMTRFLLQLGNEHSILDAAERAFQMDESVWPQLISQSGSLDVLHSGMISPDRTLEPTHIRHIVEFARRVYRIVMLDLSGNLERFSIEAMHESKRIFLVVTQEVPSLHMAREKVNYLRSLDLGDRVSLLLNRCQKRAVISPAQIEELFGQPIAMTFTNDYQGVHRAMTAGKPVDPASELGRQFNQLGQLMLERRPATSIAAVSKRKFVEYFSMNPISIFNTNKKSVG